MSNVTITKTGSGSDGKASRIAVQRFNEREALTAAKAASGSLRLRSWHTDDTAIRPGADSGTQAGKVSEVALSILGRTAVTAVRTGAGTLRLISWDVPARLGSVTRVNDSRELAGKADLITMAALDETTLVTPVRAANGKLLVIAWRLQSDGTFARLCHNDKAGGVSLVEVTSMGFINKVFVTAVRNASNNLQLISWQLSPDGSRIDRLDEQAAGTVSDIAMVRRNDIGELGRSGVVTAVRNGSGDLLLIVWGVGFDGGLGRLGDSAGKAGEASHIAIAAAGPTGTYLTSMREGSGAMKLIAFEEDRAGRLSRTGEALHIGGATETAMVSLSPERAFTAARLQNILTVNTWNVVQVPMTVKADPGEIPAGTGDPVVAG